MKFIFKPVYILVITLTMLLIIVVYNIFIPIFMLISMNCSSEEYLSQSLSPDRSILLEVYRDTGCATVDYSVKVYIKTNNSKRIIYNEYHIKDAEIVWLSDEVVQINSIQLDFSKKQTYDWRKGVRPK